MKKSIFCLVLFIVLITVFTCSFADNGGLDTIKEKGKAVLTPDSSSDHFNNVASGIVRLIQYVGSGIALLVVTIYGIKYMLASPAEKADVKKQIAPILIKIVEKYKWFKL